MLYDPKWEAPIKADPLTLASLIAWLETQPAGKTYCYRSNGHCLVAQYLLNLGYESVGVDGQGFYDHAPGAPFMKYLLPSVFNKVAISHPRTFGAALGRARELAVEPA